MKRLFIASLLTATCSGTMAANTFAGPYGGLSLGYAEGEDTNKELEDGVFDGYTGENEPGGAIFGLLGGYNWVVRSNLVLGIEADYTLNTTDDDSPARFEGVPDEDYLLSAKSEDSLSVRGRAGYLFNADKTMAYITGGYANIKLHRRYFGGADSQSSTDRQGGWAAGFGVEHFFWEKLSLQSEYRYSDYGNETVSTAEIYGDAYTQRQSYDEHSLRMSIICNF